ncbi:MAG: hypothetical protein GX853_04315 [Chloroflexi bacterium]|nr:hypothetical protein [Chloroflexota bacterium]
MDTIYLELAQALEARKPVCLCVVADSSGSVPRPAGSKMLVYADGLTSGSVGGGGLESEVINQALEAMRLGKTKLLEYSMNPNDENAVGVCGGWVKVYIEPQLEQPTLLILGAGHVGLAVAKIASLMDFRIILNDDREDALENLSVPDKVEFIACDMADLPNKVKITPQTFIIGVSRDAQLDIDGFPALLETDFAYFGAIGSRNRWIHTKDAMLEAGVLPEKADQIKSPIGLRIHAITPDEIAISILAEVIQHMHKK